MDLQGAMKQGGMVRGQVAPGTRVELDGQPVMVGPGGQFVFGLGRDAPGFATIRTIAADGSEETRRIEIAAQTYAIERVDGLPPRTVTIPPEEKARRARERGMVGQARGSMSDGLDWRGTFAWPATGRVSGVYGSQRILNGQPRTPHYGLDVAAPVNTPVRAPQAGRIVLAQKDFLLEGGIIIIDHGFGIFSTLFHLQSVDVSKGELVDKGDHIGGIGAKGRASGPHVDWRVNWNRVRLDPLLLVDGTAME
jgi:murein DD-endopeptidase MepM/ murein hydrolase activator NlpD